VAKDSIVKTFHELHDVFTRHRKSTQWIFRGQSNPEWPLTPKAGRSPYSHSDDYEFFEAWKRRAIEYLSIAPKDDWDWLAIAQHHGLATRLLDWTTNPLIATFFAIQEDLDQDAAVYAYRSRRVLVTERIAPKDLRGVAKFRPRGVASRIVRQDEIFTVHGPPKLPLEESIRSDDRLERVIIAKTLRKTLVFDLNQYGVNLNSLFPDLDGLSAHVNWFMRNSAFYGD
jgi:hypothetical protein